MTRTLASIREYFKDVEDSHAYYWDTEMFREECEYYMYNLEEYFNELPDEIPAY